MRSLVPLIVLGLAGLACAGGTDYGSGGGGGGGSAPGLHVTIGNNFFRSGNTTQNPAVDTVVVGDTVSWVWTSTGSVSHSVESEAPNPGDPTFPSSAVKTGNGKVHTVVFTAAGEYDYDCAVHGSAMSGVIVVQ